MIEKWAVGGSQYFHPRRRTQPVVWMDNGTVQIAQVRQAYRIDNGRIYHDDEETMRRALLIAAAPEMLHALLRVLAAHDMEIESGGKVYTVRKELVDVIAKAGGYNL